MIVVKRYIGRNNSLIKKIINETSEKYENFSHFFIEEIDSIYISVVLYFYENSSEYANKEERYAVEYLKDVSYNKIPQIIENASQDFLGYSSAKVIKNKKIETLADLIITYKVPKETRYFNLTTIKSYMGGGSNEYEHTTDFKYYIYYGESPLDYCFYECENIEWDLRYNFAKDFILISKFFGRGYEEPLFKLKSTLVNNQEFIKITKFIEQKNNLYSLKFSELEYDMINYKNVDDFILKFVEELQNISKIRISKQSYEFLGKPIKEKFKYISEEKLICLKV